MVIHDHLPLPTPNTARSRSFGGCSTCRSRHVKCDETHPRCSTCAFNGLKCGGYERSIFFTAAEGDDIGPTRFRRPLFTEEERKRMSKRLTDTVPSRKALRVLSQIDLECENSDGTEDVSITRGPFGAFRIVPNEQPSIVDIGSEEPEEDSSPELVIRTDQDYSSDTQLALSPWTQHVVQSTFEQPDLNAFPLFAASDDISTEVNNTQYTFGPTTLFEPPTFPDTFLLQGFAFDPPFLRPPSTRSPTPTISFLANPKNQLPPNTIPLLQHYASTVIGSFTPYRHTKTPWHVLFLPYVRQCLAVLVLNDRLDHAGMCIFYGSLSLSAFSLGGSARTSDFLDSARNYQDLAQRHAHIMLRHAYDIPKKYKYKSILMALLTLIHGCLFLDDRKHTEFYLLEAEKLIRLRGLTRPVKSRKVRLLHHCYAFTRVIHESTSFLSINESQRNHVASAVESSGIVVYGADSPTFRIRGWTNWNEEMMVLKPQDEGENDLHLERPGHYPATLYPEIFGLPEPWLLLLSQVIRLGNEKDAAAKATSFASTESNGDTLELKDFTSRARAIERAIHQLDLAGSFHVDGDPKNTTHASTNVNNGTMNTYVQRNMLQGMQDALAIYFYRRIYDIDASMLQTKVCSVRDAILRIQTAENGDDVPYGSVGFIWPAFIAACEAEDNDVQGSFTQWFGHYAERSGLPSFTSTLTLVERVWKNKRERPHTNISWLEIMKSDLTFHQFV